MTRLDFVARTFIILSIKEEKATVNDVQIVGEGLRMDVNHRTKAARRTRRIASKTGERVGIKFGVI